MRPLTGKGVLVAALVAAAHGSVSTPASAEPPAAPATPAPEPDTTPATPSPPPPTSPSFGPKDSPFAPPPNLSKNPIDVLPGDVIYPPLGDKPAKPVLWNPEWPRFSTADWIITAAGAAITLTAAILPPQKKHSLGGGIAFDGSARKTLRMPTSEGRYAARDGSDVILSFEATWPFFVDALITTWWYRGSPDAAAQMALVDGEALAIVTAIQGATNTIVSRERPYGQVCGTTLDLPAATNDCDGNVRYRSFFSGHSAFSFTGAALICVHHMENELLGPPWDALSCAGGYAVAATTATFRVVADVHYASDILLGAAVGTLVGYSVPLLHYRHMRGASGRASVTQPNQLQLHLIPSPGGIGLLGIF